MILINEIHKCPLCGNSVVEAPIGSGHLACIDWTCPYMTHYGWKKEDYIQIDGKWFGNKGGGIN